MRADARAVKNGEMSHAEYAARWGTEIYNRQQVVAQFLPIIRANGAWVAHKASPFFVDSRNMTACNCKGACRHQQTSAEPGDPKAK